jgi:hypothetical protein
MLVTKNIYVQIKLKEGTKLLKSNETFIIVKDEFFVLKILLLLTCVTKMFAKFFL